MGDSFDPCAVSIWAVSSGAGGSVLRDVRWGRSLFDGNALSHLTYMQCTCIFILFIAFLFILLLDAFSALTLLVGRQEGIRPVTN